MRIEAGLEWRRGGGRESLGCQGIYSLNTALSRVSMCWVLEKNMTSDFRLYSSPVIRPQINFYVGYCVILYANSENNRVLTV